MLIEKRRAAGMTQAEVEDPARRFVALDDQDRLRALTLYLLRLHAEVREYRRFSSTKMLLRFCLHSTRPAPA